MFSWRNLLSVSVVATVVGAIAAEEPAKPTAPKSDSEKEPALIELLKQVPEIGLTQEFFAEWKKDQEGERQAEASFMKAKEAGQPHADQITDAPSRPIVRVGQHRTWEALGLAARTNDDCQLDRQSAKVMLGLAQRLRRNGLVTVVGRDGKLRKPGFGSRSDGEGLMQVIAHTTDAYPTRALPTLMQLLQPEDTVYRMEYLEALARFNGPVVSTALANRAIFDASPLIRKRVIALLAERRPEQYRAVLLAGFRHAWAPAADHAAEALVALKDRPAIPALENLLNERDPSAPIMERGKPVVRELVRVNHLKNCLLCHAPARTRSEPLAALVPAVGKPLPTAYYSQNPSKGDILVRADVTYIRQDFSVMLPVADAKPWPEMQRFDFLVRNRPATAAELAAMKTNGKKSPQREAIVRALNGLK